MITFLEGCPCLWEIHSGAKGVRPAVYSQMIQEKINPLYCTCNSCKF